MSAVEALEQEARHRQVDMSAAWERLDLEIADAGYPAADINQPESRTERRLRMAAAAYADKANLYRAAQHALRTRIATNAERHDLAHLHHAARKPA